MLAWYNYPALFIGIWIIYASCELFKVLQKTFSIHDWICWSVNWILILHFPWQFSVSSIRHLCEKGDLWSIWAGLDDWIWMLICCISNLDRNTTSLQDHHIIFSREKKKVSKSQETADEHFVYTLNKCKSS